MPLVRCVYREIEQIAGRRVLDWPRRIECMTLREIREGRKHGAGHGLYIRRGRRIKINSTMPARDVLLNVIHENLHHAMPDATETEVDRWSDLIYERVTKPNRNGGRMAEPGQKAYHRRNIIVDRDLVLRAMDWHGGQGSMVYSFASTGLENYVSPSMIDAAVQELESDLRRTPKGSDERKDLEGIIGELDSVARFSSEHTTKEHGLGDVDSGYATWLMENGKRGNGGSRKAPGRKNRTRKAKAPVKIKGRKRSRPLRAQRSQGSVLAAALRRDK